MQTLPKYAKFTPILLFITAILFIVGDQVQFDSPTHIIEKDDPTHDHGHGGEEIDHSSPEAQRRMGVFHYNEGNKFLNKGNWEEAVTHYRMALHHNKNFEEAYVNLSTAYLSGKKFNESRKILSTLEEINPSNPSLTDELDNLITKFVLPSLSILSYSHRCLHEIISFSILFRPNIR